MTQKLGRLTYPEITGQPEALAAALQQCAVQSDWIDRYLASSDYDEIIFIGSGSSYYQSMTMAATARLWLNRPATALPSSEIYLFRRQNAVEGRRYLLVGVSRSGESTEVLLALESVKDLAGWTRCGITCHEDSSMARMVPCLVSPLGKERSTVMTKSFSSMTYMMQAAIAKAAASADMEQELAATAKASRDNVERADRFAQRLAGQGPFSRYLFLGMGAYYGLSQEAMLKVKEMAVVWSESFGTLEFRHGPKSVVEPGALVCVLVSESARSYELKVAEEMKQYGATVVLLTAREGADTAFADAVFVTGCPDSTDEARAVLNLPPLQYLGYYTALSKGIDPDSPRNLTQVVKI